MTLAKSRFRESKLPSRLYAVGTDVTRRYDLTSNLMRHIQHPLVIVSRRISYKVSSLIIYREARVILWSNAGDIESLMRRRVHDATRP